MTTTAANTASTGTFTSSASLYVGDLQPDVTEALLFEFFNAVGPVASIRVCRDAVTRRSLGYGYVNFHNIADAERALDTMNFAVIRGKSCRIMYSMRDPSLRKSGVGNIFVKNLDKSIDHKTLYDTFSMFGNILSCKVAINDKGESLGYGFVHYASPDAAQKAIDKVNEMKIANRTVYVAQFIPRSKRENSKSREGKFTNVYVKNLPKDWTLDDLVKAFEKFGKIQTWKPRITDEDGNKVEGKKEEMYVKICQGPQLGKHKIETQYGFINYESSDDATKAVKEMDGNTIEDHQLYCGRAQRKRERQARLRDQRDKRKLERQKRYQGVNLYVKNLHDKIDDVRLKELFVAFGDITSARVMMDEEQRSKGFGFVCFRTPDQATKAVTEMNSKIEQGKPLYVALAQRKEVRRQMLEQQFRQQEQGRFNAASGSNRGIPGGFNQQGFNQRGPGGFQAGGFPGGFGRMAAGGFPGGFPGGMGMGALRSPMVGGGAMMGRMGGYPRNAQRGPQANRGQTRGGPGPVRNMPQQQRPRQQGIPSPQVAGTPQSYAVNAAVGVATPTAMGQAQIDPQQLASTDDATAKQMIGERIFPLIQEREPKLAGKITGMLLEMDNTELLNLLEDSQALQSKIQEAMAVLRAHTQQQSHMSSVPSES